MGRKKTPEAVNSQADRDSKDVLLQVAFPPPFGRFAQEQLLLKLAGLGYQLRSDGRGKYSVVKISEPALPDAASRERLRTERYEPILLGQELGSGLRKFGGRKAAADCFQADLKALLTERHKLASAQLMRPLSSGEADRLAELEALLREVEAREAASVDYSAADRFDSALDKLEAYVATLTAKPN